MWRGSPYCPTRMRSLQLGLHLRCARPRGLLSNWWEAPLRGSNEIDAAMAQWGREPNFGVIVVPDPATNAHRKLINELAARHRLPVIHALRAGAADGGLISYGVDLPNVFRQTAAYADRILKGANPAELPIFLPTKFELVINLTTAKALGI